MKDNTNMSFMENMLGCAIGSLALPFLGAIKYGYTYCYYNWKFEKEIKQYLKDYYNSKPIQISDYITLIKSIDLQYNILKKKSIYKLDDNNQFLFRLSSDSGFKPLHQTLFDWVNSYEYQNLITISNNELIEHSTEFNFNNNVFIFDFGSDSIQSDIWKNSFIDSLWKKVQEIDIKNNNNGQYLTNSERTSLFQKGIWNLIRPGGLVKMIRKSI